MKVEVSINDRLRELPSLTKFEPDDIRRLLVTIDSRFVRNETQLFASEGTTGGQTWEPLSEDYAAYKARKFPGRKILQRTGKLRRSLTTKGDSDHVAYGYTQPRATLVVGSANEVGAYHAPGVKHNPRLPVRDPIQHTPAQLRDYSAVMRDYLIIKLARYARAKAARWRVVKAA